MSVTAPKQSVESPNDREGSPFHEGERRVQRRLGVREAIEPWARKVVRPLLPAEHQRFYEALPFAVMAARDRAGRPWATLLAGEPGFLSAPDPHTLVVGASLVPGDALEGALQVGADMGLLGIELHSRRRNRVNGRVGTATAEGLRLDVQQSFGNCPQYITQRQWRRASPDERGAHVPQHGTALRPQHHALIERADTFFIATGYRAEGDRDSFGMDASHRGGAPGFVLARGDRELRIPDYAGNNHFNTIGNLEMDPRAGLVFVDFATGDLLQLTGRARIDWEPAEADYARGVQRVIVFAIEELVWREGAFPHRFDARGLAARQLRLMSKTRESEDVVSFTFAARDGGALPPFVAGQHLPVELAIPGRPDRVKRTYSLSGGSHAGSYRISVKREPFGIASRFLHDQIEEGDFILASEPQGGFQVDANGERPVVLVSAGVGLTPLVSMLHALASTERETPVWFIHGARDGAHHPLRDEVEQLADRHPAVSVHVAYSRAREGDRLGDGFHSAGRVDAALVAELTSLDQADLYVCGPVAFMAEIVEGLEARGVPSERIRTESFGGAGVAAPV